MKSWKSVEQPQLLKYVHPAGNPQLSVGLRLWAVNTHGYKTVGYILGFHPHHCWLYLYSCSLLCFAVGCFFCSLLPFVAVYCCLMMFDEYLHIATNRFPTVSQTTCRSSMIFTNHHKRICGNLNNCMYLLIYMFLGCIPQRHRLPVQELQTPYPVAPENASLASRQITNKESEDLDNMKSWSHRFLIIYHKNKELQYKVYNWQTGG